MIYASSLWGEPRTEPFPVALLCEFLTRTDLMLPRVLETEAMDTLEEARDYDAMDHAEVNRRFVADLLAFAPELAAPLVELDDSAPFDAPLPASPETLDLGAGTAQIPIALCRQTPACRVAAVDLATHMLDLAKYNVEVAGLTRRILLLHADAKSLPFTDRRFAAVVSNSIVHHVPEPLSVLREPIRVCSPRGAIFFRDLFRPPDLATLDDLVARYAEGAGDHARGMFRDSLHAALTVDEVRELVASLGFSGADVQATSDRHWTWKTRIPKG